VNLPAADLLDRQTGRFLPAPALAARFAAVGAANVPVISYCGGGITASALVFARALIGRDDAQVYDASLEEWAADPALPMSTG
jgi:thiosulfate/3-mercaptopyruvate sulfurtransferase